MLPHTRERAASQDYVLGYFQPELSKLAGEMPVGLCNSLKRFESGLPSHHEAYCDVRRYQQ